MTNAQQADDEAVAAGLSLHPAPGVDQDDGQIAGGRAGGHIAGVLLVARAVGNDEFALVGAEIAISHVDGNALLPLRLQAIHQQGQVYLLVGGVVLLGVSLYRRQLILENQFGIMQQPANQGRFAVVDITAGDEAQQVLVFVLAQVFQNIAGDQIGLVGHQKYPSIFFFSIEPALSWSITRPWRSEVRVSSISWMMSGNVAAWDSTAPVSG